MSTSLRCGRRIPNRVRLDVDGTLYPMARSDGGWWRADIDARPDARYGFVLDDDPTVLPDPRSPRQPDGVHERSQLWQPAPEAWTDDDWQGRSIEGRVIYELHVGTFTPGGTFESAIEKLDYLVDLGVDFVELMPVNAFGGTHGWGYDGVGWYAVHEPYGGPDGLVRFVNACHRRGVGVLIDAVFNHLGPSGNYLPRFGPYLSSGSNPWGESINISGADADEVRRYIIDCALRWMREFHADGLRLDAVHALVDTTAIHILEELASETDAMAAELGRPLSLIAESDLNDPRLITPLDRGGLGDDRAVGRRHPSRDPHRGVGRTAGVLRRLRVAGDPGTDVEARLLPRRDILVVPASAPRSSLGYGHYPGDAPARVHRDARSGRQSCGRRPAVTEPQLRAAGGEGSSGTRVTLYRNAFHG